jgi:hypothetical protein
MALATGARLGPYQIESPLGAGGMGRQRDPGSITVVTNWRSLLRQ